MRTVISLEVPVSPDILSHMELIVFLFDMIVHVRPSDSDCCQRDSKATITAIIDDPHQVQKFEEMLKDRGIDFTTNEVP